MLNKLIQAGIEKGEEPSERMRIQLLNKMVLVFIFGVGIKCLNELYVQDIVGSIITISLILMFFLVILFNHFGFHVIARQHFLIINTAFLVIINVMYGRTFGSELILFPLIMVVVLYFESNRSKIIWVSIFCISYIGSRIYLSYNEPLFLDNLDPNSFYFMLLITTLVVFLLSSVFINENMQFKNQTNDLLKKLRTQNEDLESANNELEKFAFIASHDLKTPLRNINSFLKLIERKIKQGNTGDIPEYLEFASLNAKRMHNLIQDILEFSRVNTKEVALKQLDLDSVLKTALNNLQDLITSKNAEVNAGLLPNFLCNETQMILLFQNLIENGIKYNKSDKPVINIRLEEMPLEYHIYIEDNGIGIEQDYQEKVFEMFYRLHNQEEYSGTGIGLATSKKIAMYHGGGLSIESSSPEGTVFLLKFLRGSHEIPGADFKTEDNASETEHARA